GIRDDLVTGVQTCALPIYYKYGDPLGYKDRSDALFHSILKNWGNIKYLFLPAESFKDYLVSAGYSLPNESYLGYYAESTFMTSKIGRASCRERRDIYLVEI